MFITAFFMKQACFQSLDNTYTTVFFKLETAKGTNKIEIKSVSIAETVI